MHWTVRHAVTTKHTDEHGTPAFLSVVLAEQPGPKGRYIEFQLDLDEDEREDGYCVMDAAPPSYDGDPIALGLAIGTHKTLYGAVKECRLDNELLTFRFTWKARRIFGWPRKLKLSLALPEDQGAALRRGLVEVFAFAPPRERPPRVIV
ncbi:hypothetical protein AB0869_15235 [Micromonospora vinacea]|uniref:hypothetical protein n=1 Tax=Micromonospora vinacea TaxID=709878 RepID=UPI003455C812